MPIKPASRTPRNRREPNTPTTDRNDPAARTPPVSEDAERALLGAMLQGSAAIGEAISVLQSLGPEAFFYESHQTLYDNLVAMYDASKPMDGVVIKDELIRRGCFQSLGGYDFLVGLIDSVPSPQRARDYGRIVLEKCLLRKLINATHRAMQAAYDDDQSAQQILDYAESEIFSVTERRVTDGAAALPDLVHEVFRQLDQRGEGVITGEPTGYYELDELTCGLQPAELIIVAGRPSMGKTALGLNIAEHLAIQEDPPRPVLFFSLEMSRQQVAQRILCSRARVNSHHFRRGRIGPAERDRLFAAAEEITGKPLLIDDASGLSLLELRARARMAVRKNRIRAILVDYLQLLHVFNAESRQAEVAEISRGLKALAKELNVPVVAMAQLNRNPEDRTGNRPRMSDLRESGAIEQDADLIMLLHRESYYKAKEDPAADADPGALLIVAKQRNGPVGDVELHFNCELTRFDNPMPVGRYQNYPEAGYSGPRIVASAPASQDDATF